ncbi:hypothetical protein MHH94_08645 [Mammaliicoccus sp. FSL K6-3158]|uniref:hypothetical protein n=1 Tax=Mammaliicoccus TaxID=2803850 RepID=UPI000E68C505|nr:hypothetical protein [Mammaliicoccus sciuri]RIN98324.1 hypothetical protein BU000_07235 [Mammaliicoccus sciuri]
MKFKKSHKIALSLVLTTSIITPYASEAFAEENQVDIQNTQEASSLPGFENTEFLPMETYTHGNEENGLSLYAAKKGTKTIKTGKYVKKQGYMTNAQLRKYVKYVDKQKGRMGWASLVIGVGPLFTGVPQGILMQYLGNKNNFEIVKKKAYAGYGMGWAHLSATGKKNSLSVIPRRDFSKTKIVYKK